MDAITNPNPANYITSGLGFGTERRDVEGGRASLGATAIMDSEFGRIKIRERKTWSAVRELRVSKNHNFRRPRPP